VKTDSINGKFNSTNDKKYELFQDDTARQLGLYRIRALRDFGDVKKGEIGGFVSSEHNLSQQGKCWIGSPASVTGEARVSDDAFVGGCVRLNGDWVVNGTRHIFIPPPDESPHQDVDP